jgi:aminopeptidase YwaD
MDPWFMGDHMIFVQKGVPAAALTTTEFVDVWKRIAHTQKDTIDLVDPALLAGAARFIFTWIRELT